MDLNAGRRLTIAYWGGTALFTALAILFRAPVIAGLVTMPVIMHLIKAERARRARLGFKNRPEAALHTVFIARELAFVAVLVSIAVFVQIRLAGSRNVLAQAAVVVSMVAYVVTLQLSIWRAQLIMARANNVATRDGEKPESQAAPANKEEPLE